MNISRFFGATNREAMRQVRLALGPDALIISNKRVNGGVEILATDQTSLPDQPTQAQNSSRAAVAKPAADRPAPQPPVADRPAGAELLGAIDDLKGSLESRIDELLWGSKLRQSPQAVALFQSLLRFGFSTSLLRAMLSRMPEHANVRAAFQWARNELVKHLPVLSSEDGLWQPGLALALVGPTGVGKTTTIAKLAARCVRRSGPGSLVLLTTDTYRIGAHEQLKIYGQMLHVPVHIVRDVHELRSILQSLRPDQTVLIDNVGISQRDRYISDQAALLAGAGRRVERLLALNASSHGDTLDEVARSYAKDGGTPLRGCIITKIDEASRLGAALDTAIRYKLPIHYVSNGQKVPENLLFMSAAELVDQALVPAQSARTLYAPSEADLAALLSMAQVDEPQPGSVQHRRQTLLPRLLAQPSVGEPLGIEQLQQAASMQDEDAVLSEAFDLWRGHNAGNMPAASETIEHLRRVAHGSIAEGETAIVVHNRQAMAWQGRRGTWVGAAWFGADGQPLAVTTQQAGMADGWYGPHGALAVAPSATDVLLDQISTESQDSQSDLLHVFDGGSQALMRALHESGVQWLANCSSRSRVFKDGEAIVLSAATNKLMFKPLDAHVFSHLNSPANLQADHTAWWVATGSAELRARGQDDLPVRVFCLRAVDSLDGKVLRVWYALAGMSADPDLALMARALIMRRECQSAWRTAVPMLAAKGREPLVDMAVFAAQMGLAAWRLVQDPALAPASDAAASLLGTRKLSMRQGHDGLLKLYALKEMLEA